MNTFEQVTKRVSKRVNKIFRDNVQPVSKAMGNLAQDIADETLAEVEEVKKMAVAKKKTAAKRKPAAKKAVAAKKPAAKRKPAKRKPAAKKK